MNYSDLNLMILGSSGGVARAVLSLLNKVVQDISNPIYHYINNSKIHLVDQNQKPIEYYEQLFPNLKGKIVLHQFNLNNLKLFSEYLKITNTNFVIDVSYANTVEIIRSCNELGVNYINTAIESGKSYEGEDCSKTGIVDSYKIFEENRSSFSKIKGIIGSGMNPGIVQWMVIELLKQTPNETPMACYIVERDNSFYADKSLVEKNTIYSTWSTKSFLEETITDYPLFVRNHEPVVLCNNAFDLEFKVSLGEVQFYGSLFPHEEVLTLGKIYDMEIGFIYRVNDYTLDFIRSNLRNLDYIYNSNHKILDPMKAELVGEDLVGILLVFEDRERFMYNQMTNQDAFNSYDISATYFQVACGIYGALSTLLLDSIPLGIYYVDELLIKTNSLYGRYISYFMNDFVIGENTISDGLLLERYTNRSISIENNKKLKLLRLESLSPLKELYA
ncbi:S-adenosylmethionine decarboxylase related protein [Brevibacillus brevis X23]|nr:S-adenosylmethionine decarboxylase related protein [Brevibacillus brevis X23]